MPYKAPPTVLVILEVELPVSYYIELEYVLIVNAPESPPGVVDVIVEMLIEIAVPPIYSIENGLLIVTTYPDLVTDENVAWHYEQDTGAAVIEEDNVIEFGIVI